MARMVAPISSIKHLVGFTLSTVTSGTTVERLIALGVNAPATAAASDVVQGSVLKNIYVEIWITGAGTAGQQTSFQVNLERKSGGQPNMTFANALNLTAYENKRNVLYVTQGAVNSSTAGQSAVPVIRQWFKIPKGKQRMALGDEYVLNISALAINLIICGIFIYKEYS